MYFSIIIQENTNFFFRAAFQFGVKMNEGRKTRRGQGEQKEKAKIEKEWTQISKIIEKRKAGDGSGDFKKPKY